MFGISGQELILILLVALIVLGPKKLPEMAKTIGKALGEFQRATDDFKREIDISSREKSARPEPEPAPKKDVREPASEEAKPLEQERPSDKGESSSGESKTGDDPIAYRPGEIEG
ncbi:MAG: twin-arginine translocase TatA/TatE family subunit [Desulfomonilia bacterium]|nr:twin-arginine translocase TatA/TatE family subunit [Deltaproteobacteria bacterium]